METEEVQWKMAPFKLSPFKIKTTNLMSVALSHQKVNVNYASHKWN